MGVSQNCDPLKTKTLFLLIALQSTNQRAFGDTFKSGRARTPPPLPRPHPYGQAHGLRPVGPLA